AELSPRRRDRQVGRADLHSVADRLLGVRHHVQAQHVVPVGELDRSGIASHRTPARDDGSGIDVAFPLREAAATRRAGFTLPASLLVVAFLVAFSEITVLAGRTIGAEDARRSA